MRCATVAAMGAAMVVVPTGTLAVDAVVGEKQLQAMMWLEKDGEPPRGGFTGEKGLLYAYVLTKRNYYRHALEQINGLEAKDDPVAKSALFDLLSGFVNAKRRRYSTSMDHYVRASERLMETDEPSQ